MKPVVFLTIAVIFGGLVAQSFGDEKPSAAHARLLGKWKAEWVEANGQRNEPEGAAANAIEFQAKHILVGDQKVEYTVDTETTPMLIDLSVKVGDEEQPRSLEGIYKFTDDKLMICVFLSTDGTANRPDKFETTDGSKRVMILLSKAE